MSKIVIYNKLVRDKIPQIIKKSGKDYRVHIADETEYKTMLQDKLREEVDELIENPCIEEIADVLEVLESITQYYSFNKEDIQNYKKKKQTDRGGFCERLILEKVIG